jgi:hypothetical protein
MKVHVSYVWDSETNTYSPDTEQAEVTVSPSENDRLVWNWATRGHKPRNGSMGLTRGFETLMYLSGFANDVVNKASRLPG